MSQEHAIGATPAVDCPRHGRSEWPLACTRCGTPTCPYCLTPAAVGSHCPDCVRGGSQAPGRPGPGRAVARPLGTPGAVVRALISVNVVVFLAQVLGPGGGPFALGDLVREYSMQPEAVARGEWYRLLTAAFLHGSVLHIGFNMFALYAFGPQLEAALGRVRFLALYLAAALGGSALSYLLSPPTIRGVGASGAIFGVLGAAFVVVRLSGGDPGPIARLLGLNLLIGFVVPFIDWRAHLGGLAVGAALAWAFARVPRGPRRPAYQALAVVAALGAVAAVVVVRTAALTSALG